MSLVIVRSRKNPRKFENRIEIEQYLTHVQIPETERNLTPSSDLFWKQKVFNLWLNYFSFLNCC